MHGHHQCHIEINSLVYVKIYVGWKFKKLITRGQLGREHSWYWTSTVTNSSAGNHLIVMVILKLLKAVCTEFC
jgi:hypothetical protein